MYLWWGRKMYQFFWTLCWWITLCMFYCSFLQIVLTAPGWKSLPMYWIIRKAKVQHRTPAGGLTGLCDGKQNDNAALRCGRYFRYECQQENEWWQWQSTGLSYYREIPQRKYMLCEMSHKSVKTPWVRWLVFMQDIRNHLVVRLKFWY